MHTEALHFITLIKALFPGYFREVNVLEIGSQDINGSPRPLFKRCVYTGIDIGPGKGVDHISNGADWPYYGYRTVVCMEVAEHDERWEETLNNAKDCLWPGGALIFSCAGEGREEHGTKRTETKSSPYTTDYYKNITPQMIEGIPGFLEGWEFAMFGVDEGHGDTYFFGIKKDNTPRLALEFRRNKLIIIKYHTLFFLLQRVKDIKNTLRNVSSFWNKRSKN